MYCERCEYLGHARDQYGWQFKTCNHPVNNGKFCGELKKCPINNFSNIIIFYNNFFISI